MVSAVSGVLSQTPTTSTSGEVASYHWFKMPDLSRATHRLLGQSGAGWTFETICRLVHLVGRVGRPQSKKAAKDLGRLGVGLQAIADEAGISVSKVRRDLVKLVDLGLVAVSRRNVTFKADPATGKIRENRTGRSLPVTVFLTIGPEHSRSKSTQEPAANPPRMAPSNPSILEGASVLNRDHPGGAIQREEFKRRPSGDAVGIGSPPASQEGSLEAGHESATQEPPSAGIGRENACQEPGAVRVDAEHDELPIPIGQRISRPASAPPQQAGRPSGRKSFLEDHREPQVWSGSADEARRRMLSQIEEQRRRDAAVIEAEKAAGLLTTRQRAMMARKA